MRTTGHGHPWATADREPPPDTLSHREGNEGGYPCPFLTYRDVVIGVEWGNGHTGREWGIYMVSYIPLYPTNSPILASIIPNKDK